VLAEQESAQCRFGTPIVDGDQVAVPWSAQTRLTDGGTEDLAGVIAAFQGRWARRARA